MDYLQREKYARFLEERYLLNQKDRKYCPFPGCENVLLEKDGIRQ